APLIHRFPHHAARARSAFSIARSLRIRWPVSPRRCCTSPTAMVSAATPPPRRRSNWRPLSPGRQRVIMSEHPDFVVVAPPPTPNGDLHVGHLAGPYLSADVFTRFERLRGRTVLSAISTDENQSYVVTTAECLGRAPRDL